MTGSADVGKHATQTTNEKRGAGESKLPRTNATVDSNVSDNATGVSGSGGDAFRQQPYNSGRAKQSTKNSKRQTSGSGQKAPKGATSNQQTSSSDNLSNCVSEEPFTMACNNGMSRTDILKTLGSNSRNALGKLKAQLLKSSITSFVEKMPVLQVKAGNCSQRWVIE